MNWSKAKQQIESGKKIRRISWAACRFIRASDESDCDYIPNMDLRNVIIDYCDKNCDCSITVYSITEEDKNADNWQVI